MKAQITSLFVIIIMIFSSCEKSEIELSETQKSVKEKPYLEKIKLSEAKDYEYLKNKIKNVNKSSIGS